MAQLSHAVVLLPDGGRQFHYLNTLLHRTNIDLAWLDVAPHTDVICTSPRSYAANIPNASDPGLEMIY